MARFKLIRRRKPSLKTALGVTGAKRRARNSLKRSMGLSSRTRTTFRSHRRKGVVSKLGAAFFGGIFKSFRTAGRTRGF